MGHRLFEPAVEPDPIPVPAPTAVTGGGSGQTGVTLPAEPISFSAWMDSDWKDEYFLDGEINEDDYAMWWEICQFSQADWERLNPDLPWDAYFG